jgi:hypothetical protein
MASNNQDIRGPQWHSGRAFASMDPERQREVVGYVRSGPIETAPAPRGTSARSARNARLDWLGVQADRDNFEGSSSRHSR